MVINEVASIYHSFFNERIKKERGYQSINLESLAIMNEKFPEHHFWDSEMFCKSLQFLLENESEIIEGIRTKHGDQIPGISIAKVRHQFTDSSLETISALVGCELIDNLESDSVPLETSNVDDDTGDALISGVTSLPDVELNRY
jgi:hypothetical protein